MPYNLIIFDCDGTLVDSEYLLCKVTSDILLEAGCHRHTVEVCMEEHVGKTMETILEELNDEYGKETAPQDLIEQHEKRVSESMSPENVILIDHAKDILEQTCKTHKICVASNGQRPHVLKSLEVNNLLPFFGEDKVFTKSQVRQGKPAPDLFLYAAEKMGEKPENCIVLEDSPSGVKAAVNAKMEIIGFTGSAHDPEKQALSLKEAGASKVIGSLHEFLEIVNKS